MFLLMGVTALTATFVFCTITAIRQGWTAIDTKYAVVSWTWVSVLWGFVLFGG